MIAQYTFENGPDCHRRRQIGAAPLYAPRKAGPVGHHLAAGDSTAIQENRTAGAMIGAA